MRVPAPGVSAAALPPISTGLVQTRWCTLGRLRKLAYLSVTHFPGDCCATTVPMPTQRDGESRTDPAHDRSPGDASRVWPATMSRMTSGANNRTHVAQVKPGSSPAVPRTDFCHCLSRGLRRTLRRKAFNLKSFPAREERYMSPGLRRLLVIVAATSLAAIIVGDHVRAQNPPARGLRWSKAAPFPEPEEELYGTVVNGKLYVVGGFGFTPQGVTPAPAPNNAGPCFSCPPALVYEYDPGADKWTKKKPIPVRVHHQAQAGYNGKLYILGGCVRAISGEGGTTMRGIRSRRRLLQSARADSGKRCSPQAEEVGGKIYLIGGLEPMENGTGTRVTGRTRCMTRRPTRGPNAARCRPVATTRFGRGQRQDLRHRRTDRRRQHSRDDQH